ncbi:MAG: RagB/SusD family nutrient uptake outer membrane protein [Bacteroides sp.]|nr:RagB/SusD family nutrient uptake outer membrane protein [Bacteroides sp.]
MNKIFSSILVGAASMMLFTGCLEEFQPEASFVTGEQAANAPGSYETFVGGLTSSTTGKFLYSPSNEYPWDFGYTTFYLMRDVQGQDLVLEYDGSWYSTWYQCGRMLGPGYRDCQISWTLYYSWIKDCNTVISLAGPDPAEDKKVGAGIAYAMRALYYSELAQMFAQKTYGADPDAMTVPIVTESTALETLASNPRATNKDMWDLIISDLDKAEEYLAGYTRQDKYTPDQSVAYGLKARAYLVMRDWANAEKYAKLAQNGYAAMDNDYYTSKNDGFNSSNNSSWMFATRFKSDDPNILNNDGDSSWPSQMCLEMSNDPLTAGYASNYGDPKYIDRHLYETIPATDARRKCFVDFAVDEMATKAEALAALGEYSDFPDRLFYTAYEQGNVSAAGGLSVKFRAAGGTAGRNNQYIGFLVDVPIMRVEEMILIEAEAAGMQDESRGQALLTTFGKLRDPNYVYGSHNEAYYNNSTSKFQNEVWWQRRVELWGEGLATFDIKRLEKGVIRSYAGTNHLDGFQWNTTTPPDWMNWCIVQTETNYNSAIVNNPTPVAPEGNSPQYAW